MKGKLYGVSTGPGDPELMTIKAVTIIDACPVIAVPRTAGKKHLALEIASQVCELSGKEIIFLDSPMSRDPDVCEKAHENAAGLIAKFLESGKDAAMLNIGDISVYSTFSYIAERIAALGYEYEVCPGVTSFCAAAASLKIPLVQGNEPLVLIPSEDCIDANKTFVLMKRARSLVKTLEGDEIYAAESCGLENEKLYRSADELPLESGYFTTIIAKKKYNGGKKI